MGRRGADLVSSGVSLPSAQPLCQAAPAFLRFLSLIFSLWFLPLGTNLRGKLGSSLWGWGTPSPSFAVETTPLSLQRLGWSQRVGQPLLAHTLLG